MSIPTYHLTNAAVVEYANEAGLWPCEAEVLDRLVLRGKRIETKEQARLVWRAIRMVCNADAGPPFYKHRPAVTLMGIRV